MLRHGIRVAIEFDPIEKETPGGFIFGTIVGHYTVQERWFTPPETDQNSVDMGYIVDLDHEYRGLIANETEVKSWVRYLPVHGDNVHGIEGEEHEAILRARSLSLLVKYRDDMEAEEAEPSGYKRFSDVVRDVTPEQRARIEEIKREVQP